MIRTALRAEGGAFFSATLRDILRRYLGVTVGSYAYGTCLHPGVLPPGVSVGRYASVGARSLSVYRRNHPTRWLSTSALFFNSKLGFVPEDGMQNAPLEIGPDAWVGDGVIITAGCSRIGIGAIVAAGAVVTRDVEDLAIVAGTPARVVRTRFSDTVCKAIARSKWWEQELPDLLRHANEMMSDLGECAWSSHPLLRSNHPGVKA